MDDDDFKDEGLETMMEEMDDDGGGKLDMNNSSTSLDKYVGKGRNSKYMTLLPEDFEPGEMDVLCGRGKRCFNSPGNQRFRKLVAARADDYSAATTRTDKTFIVCSIVAEVRKASPKGGFVKKDSATGRWYEVGDFNAHEKTSQMFRDVLHENYLSSNKSKKKRRDLFRTNSKRRALMQQQAEAAKSINASAGRFLRGNGVARHHSYGSVKRAVGSNPFNLMNMRTHAHAGGEPWRQSSAHSVHSGHESWHNSFQSGDGIKSEPGIILSNDPRLQFASRRQNSMGDILDNNSFGELQAQDQFHNSFGEFNTGDIMMGQHNFHNSCVEFPSSFAENNHNGNQNRLGPSSFHNSFGGFRTNSNLFRGDDKEFNINQDDFHNSFGEIRNYRAQNNFSPNPNAEPQYTLETPSVPLSISVPEGTQSGGFQLEFEADENSGSQNRSRGRMPESNLLDTGATQPPVAAIHPGMNLFDALEGAYDNQQRLGSDENPFEPLPLPDMEPESIFN